MAKETKKNKKEKKEKKTFLKDFKSELKKVIWPTPKQLLNNTTTVIIIVLLTAAIVFVLDFSFDKGYQFVITKAESIVKKDDTNTESQENVVTENETESGAEVTTEEINTENTETTEENTTAE